MGGSGGEGKGGGGRGSEGGQRWGGGGEGRGGRDERGGLLKMRRSGVIDMWQGFLHMSHAWQQPKLSALL